MKKTNTRSSAAQATKSEPVFAKNRHQGFFGRSGNRNSFFSKSAIQCKLTVGKSGDSYEKEADSVADHVVQRLHTNEPSRKESVNNTTPIANSISPLVQMKCAECEKEERLQKKENEDAPEVQLWRKPIFESNAEEETVQRKCSHCEQEEKKVQRSGNDETETLPDIESSLQNQGSGSPLPADVNDSMSSAFGSDFSNVRIHTDSSAVQMSKNLNAQAFTYGSDIYFNSGKYNSSSSSGKHLLAHELTHTIQQGGSTKSPSIAKKKIQRVSTIYWEPQPWNGTQEHKKILGDITNQESALVIEGPIPNAQRGKKGPGSAADYGKSGFADFYEGYSKSDTSTVIGLYAWRPGTVTALDRSKAEQDGRKFTGSVAPEIVGPKKVKDVNDAPEKITLGDLKPINSLEGSHGVEQLEAYEKGITQYAAPETNQLTKDGPWKPNVKFYSKKAIDDMVPDKYRPGASDPFVKTSILKGDKAGKELRVETRLVAVADEVNPGIMCYAWVPMQPVTLEQIPTKIRDMGKDVTDNIIDPLKAPPPVKKKEGKTGRKKENTHVKENHQTTVVSKTAEPQVQKSPDKEFDLKKWEENKKRISGEYKKIKKTADIKKVEGVELRMDADKLIEKHTGIKTPKYGEDVTKSVDTLERIRFWTNPLTSLFGKFKVLLGSAFNVFVNGFHKLKGWIQGIARKLKFSGGGGLLGSAMKAVFNLLKVIARVLVSTVVELFVADIEKGIQKKIDALVKSLDVESTIEYVKTITAPIQTAIQGFESWVSNTLQKYNSYFEKINAVVETLSFINDIINKVRWVARAIACVSPPLLGCLWNLALSAIEKVASWVVETCWFRSKISPWVLGMDFVKDLGKEIYGMLKEHLVGYLPGPIQEFFVDNEEKKIPKPTDEDLKCGAGGGDGEGGGGEMTPAQEEVMKLQEQLGEEKFLALLELMKKAKLDEKTTMSADQVKELAKAVENMSAEDIKKMADSYEKQNTKEVPKSIKDALENIKKHAPKGTDLGQQTFDAEAKEKEVEALEAKKDAAETLEEEGGLPPDQMMGASTEPAAALIDLMLSAQDKKNQVILENNGKLTVNEALKEKFIKTGVTLFALKVAAEFKQFEIKIFDVTRDNTPLVQVMIVVEIHITQSDNQLIPPGLIDKATRNILWDPKARQGRRLQKPSAVNRIISKIQGKEKGITGVEYDFAEMNFKARLTEIVVKDESAQLSFVITSADVPGEAVIYDYKDQKFISVKVGVKFMIIDSCSGCKSMIQKKEIEGAALNGNSLQLKSIFESEDEEPEIQKCESCEKENITKRQDTPSIQKDDPPAPDPNTVSIDKVYNALSGWTDSDDSAVILKEINGKAKGTTDTIIKGVSDKADSNGVVYVMEWMNSDMVTSDWKALLSHLISVRAYLIETVIGNKLYNLLWGYTSEDDSTEIMSFIMGDTPVTGELLDSSLYKLEAKGEYERDFASEKLFDDMKATDAIRLSNHFFGQGVYSQGYAAHWRAYKVKKLVDGFTGWEDSYSIYKNFDQVPEKMRITVWYELDKLFKADGKEDVPKILMKNMQQDHYESLQKLVPLLPAYDPTQSFLEWAWSKITNLGDFLMGALEYGLCGLVGIVLGILSIITDLIGAIIDILIAAKDIIGLVIYGISGGKFCRENKDRVFNFFKGIGEFFGAPGEAISHMWTDLTTEAGAIEGPFTECKHAIFWVTRVTNLIVNIILIFVAGYGAVKLALEGLEAIILVVRAGELLNALKSIPGRLWTAIKKLPPAIAKSIMTNVKSVVSLITKPAKVLQAIREVLGVIKLAYTDEKFFLFLREQVARSVSRNIAEFKEKELEFWKKRKDFWKADSEKVAGSADAVDGKLIDAANSTVDDTAKAEKIAGEAEKDASNVSKEADDLMDDVQTSGSAAGSTPSFESQIPEKWKVGSAERPPKLDPTITRMRGMGVSDDTILAIIKNVAGKPDDAALFFGDLNRFIIKYEKFVGKEGFDDIMRALASEKDFAIGKSLMTQVSNGQNITDIMRVFTVKDLGPLRARFPGADKDFINDLTSIVTRVSGGKDNVLLALNDAGDPATLNKALDRLGPGQHSPIKIRESLEFGSKLAKAISTSADEVAKSIWGDAIEIDSSGRVVRDAEGKLKFTGKLTKDKPGDLVSAYIRARREQISEVLLGGKTGTAIDNTNWGIIKEVLTNSNLPQIVKNDILGEVWAFTKVRQYENLGYTVIREVAFKVLGADGVETGVEARLDAVLKKGNEVLYKEFKSSLTAETSKGQDAVYDLLNKGSTKSLKPYGANAEKAFGGPGCPEFKATGVGIERAPF